MRLIDADDIAYESIDSSDTNRHEYYYGTGIIAVRKEDIDAMPTIEERKTGRWEDVHIDVANDDKGRSYRFYSCTACGVTSIPAMLGMKKKWLHFCPNCGAKMEDCEE